MSVRSEVDQAALALNRATALLVTAGAGMGVDSGLPDFRGPEGFWNAYPPYREMGLRFEDLANPHWFDADPHLAWGFYGHRLNLYRATQPHEGFAILLRWARAMRSGWFVFTSNVDGHFQRAGFEADRIYECHGAIDLLQCTAACGVGILSAEGIQVSVDERSFRAAEPLPYCPGCGALLRPNILMFRDWQWDSTRSDAQEERLEHWLDSLDRDARLVVIECGAGTSVPTVRIFSEKAAGNGNRTMIRINLREPRIAPPHVSLPMDALEALRAIDAQMRCIASP